MDIATTIKKLDQTFGKPRFRAAHGQWKPYAWIVRGLVERGHQVTDSVRLVIRESGLTPPEVAERSIRSAYYKIKNRPWPAHYAALVAQHGLTNQPDEEDDEV